MIFSTVCRCLSLSKVTRFYFKAINSGAAVHNQRIFRNHNEIKQQIEKEIKKRPSLELCLVGGIIIVNIYFKYMIHFHRVMLDQYIITNWNRVLRFKNIPMLREQNVFLWRMKTTFYSCILTTECVKLFCK